MKIKRFLFIIIITLLCNNCKNKINNHGNVQFDHVELLKNALLKHGFQSDYFYNESYEYKWIKKSTNEKIMLSRSACFFYSNAPCQTIRNCTNKILITLTIEELMYQYNDTSSYTFENYLSQIKMPEVFHISKNIFTRNFPREFEEYKKKYDTTIVLNDRYVILSLNVPSDCQLDSSELNNVANIIVKGIHETDSINVTKIYGLLDTLSYIKFINKNSTFNSVKQKEEDLDAPLYEIERERIHNTTLFPCFCRCIDLRGDPQKVTQIGYISLKIFGQSGLAAQNLPCILKNSQGKTFPNRTDSIGCIKWCRVYKDDYTVEFTIHEKRYVYPALWDSLRTFHIINLRTFTSE